MAADAKRVRRIRRNAESTIRAARSTGRLEACDDLLVALVRTASDACDEQRGGEGETLALRLAADLEARLRAVGGPSTMLSTSFWPRLRVPPRLATPPSGSVPSWGPAVDAVGAEPVRPADAGVAVGGQPRGRRVRPGHGEMVHNVVVLHVPRRAGKSAI